MANRDEMAPDGNPGFRRAGDPSTPLEMRGTYAERLAAAHCSAEHALWAVQYGADWPAAWRECPRLDWLVQAWFLTECREQGSPAHRRVVGWLAAECRAILEAASSHPTLGRAFATPPEVRMEDPPPLGFAVRAAVDFALRWAWGGVSSPPAFVALGVLALFPVEVSGRSGLELAVAAAAMRVAYAVLDPASGEEAARALSAASSGGVSCPDLVRRFVAVFDVPAALRCGLPD